MNAVYESGLKLVCDKSKQKGYQATFNEFIKSTSSSTKIAHVAEVLMYHWMNLL